MNFSNISYNVLYVDPSIATPGDGATPATALKNLPSTTSLVSGTCYLIRRTTEDAFCTLAGASASSLANILLWGMPKSTDMEWHFIANAARTAWGNDDADYANLQITTPTTAIGLPAIKNFCGLGLYTFRVATANPSVYMFDFTGTSRTASIRFSRCKFGAQGIHFDDPEYQLPVTTQAARQYVKVASSRVCVIEDCIITHTLSSYGMGGNYAMQIGPSDYIALRNLKIPTLNQSYSSGYAIYLDDNSGRVAISNIQAEILLNGSGQYIPAILRCGSNSVATAKDISATMPRVMAGTTTTSLAISQPLFAFNSVGAFQLQDFTADLPRCWRLLAAGSVLKIDGSNLAPGAAPARKVRNVLVQAAETDGIGAGADVTWVAAGCEYSAVAIDFSGGYITPTGTGSVARMDVSDVTINHPRGIALYANGVQLTNTAVKGAVKLKASQAVISTIASWYPTNALIADGYTTVTVDAITVKTDNADFPYTGQAIVTSNDKYCVVYVGNCNVPLQPNTAAVTTTISNQYTVICGNEGATGHFAQRTNNCICDTWTVYRQGGADASLKLYNNAVAVTTSMQMGQFPFAGIRLTPTATGKHLLKIHIATKIADLSELGQRFIAVATVPTADGNSKMYFSNVHGQCESDASYWLNDEGLTAKVLIIPLAVEKLGAENAIDVKLDFNWYSPDGFLYVDPKFELTPATGE